MLGFTNSILILAKLKLKTNTFQNNIAQKYQKYLEIKSRLYALWPSREG